MAVVLCMGCLATLLTTWVLRLYHKASDQPVTPFYHVLATRVLVPFKNCTRCKKKHEDDDKVNPAPHNKTKVVPLQARPVSALKSRRKFVGFGTSLKITELPDGMDDVTGGDVCGREETDPIYTWQEIAVLLDYLFLWLFAVNLIIVSTVILSLLYAKY